MPGSFTTRKSNSQAIGLTGAGTLLSLPADFLKGQSRRRNFLLECGSVWAISHGQG